jgi:hypothetical protein
MANGIGVATLRDVLSPRVPTIDGDDLTDENRAALTIMRIEAQHDLRVAARGGVLDKARAIEEVRRDTPLGRVLVKVEHQAIGFLKEIAAQQRRRREAKKRPKTRAMTSTRRTRR